MKPIIIKNALVVNENKITASDILIKNGIIEKISSTITETNATIIDAEGLYILPGCIDDQVHFREPGLTHKGNIYSESKAAVAGGITSFMDMPNTIPNTLTQELLEEKYQIAARSSLANYSFYMGASNDNLHEVLQTNPKSVCGIKIFMGSSTGNMLVNDDRTLRQLFNHAPLLIATHCEDENTIQKNINYFKIKYGDSLSAVHHPLIRNEEACYLSSSYAIALAHEYKTRLHVLHISTEKELELFDNSIPISEKRITAEACVHHLYFSDNDYHERGNWIKWNPAIKTEKDRKALLQGIIDNKIDVIATDHAPHTIIEKEQTYLKAPSGGPLVQHALPALLELYHQDEISLETIVEKTSHNVATCFQLEKRGFIREGYWADLVLVNLTSPWRVKKSNVLYHCGWSPFEGHNFHSQITHTFVSGNLVYEKGTFNESSKGKRLSFDRP